jgi:predicted GNAT family acetyltransferase
MEVKHQDLGDKGKFYIEENGKRAARMTYVVDSEGRLVVEHTYVEPEFEGKGLGKILVRTVVEYVRTHGLELVPVCPYTKSVIEKTKEYQDVLAK